jgi:cytochrome P450
VSLSAADDRLISRALTAWATSNVAAGSDTTAILLRTIIWNLLRHSTSLQRLLEELEQARKDERLSKLVTWKESQKLPYLDAIIKEAGRIHPPFGLPLERVVPAQGATICGKFLPAGTVVGISPWVMNHDKGIFGDDADEWRPERWLVEDKIKRKAMENALFTVSQ